jgi:hypothetical protein
MELGFTRRVQSGESKAKNQGGEREKIQ